MCVYFISGECTRELMLYYCSPIPANIMSAVDSLDVTVFGWGMTSHGQLGVGGVEEEQVCLPKVIGTLRNQPVKKIACGREHTLFEVDGLLSCGNNDHGQLGQQQTSKKPGTSLINKLSLCGC